VSSVRVLLADHEDPAMLGDSMKFRLIYRGPLNASQGVAHDGQKVKHAAQKNAIRRQIHHQMKRLWQTNLWLSKADAWPSEYGLEGRLEHRKYALDELLGQCHEKAGRKFVPLARDDWYLHCGLDILFLRKDPPGSFVTAGDIDNRIKTLLDGLRIPQNANEMVGMEDHEGIAEPFYCLLEDDKMIVSLSVDTDRLLDSDDGDQSEVLLVINVTLRPVVSQFEIRG